MSTFLRKLIRMVWPRKHSLDGTSIFVSSRLPPMKNFYFLYGQKVTKSKGETFGEDAAKYISFHPLDKERFVRGSARSLGKEYTRSRTLISADTRARSSFMTAQDGYRNNRQKTKITAYKNEIGSYFFFSCLPANGIFGFGHYPRLPTVIFIIFLNWFIIPTKTIFGHINFSSLPAVYSSYIHQFWLLR